MVMKNADTLITSPDSPALAELCQRLAAEAGDVDARTQWPADQLRWCGQYGVFRWFLPKRWGGYDWALPDVVRGYLALSKACLTTTFVITQRTAAVRRIAACTNESLRKELLPGLATGELFASVGISHLTTSRRHLGKPVLAATEQSGGFVLDGYSPWVTSGKHCDWIVTGATLDDGRQILAAVDTRSPGLSFDRPADLVALSASDTGAVQFAQVEVPAQWMLDGPINDVMTRAAGGNTGGLETSTLAVGLAGAAIELLEREARKRNDLEDSASALRIEYAALRDDLLAMAAGNDVCTKESLRARSNSLALRSTQAALAAAKGAGFVRGHPAGRWCREALFFLVWSCPQPVMQAALCELANLG